MADATTSGSSPPGTSVPAQRSRFRLHYVYYALAAFDVIALSISVWILVWITTSYRESVAVNDYWTDRMRQHWSLIDLASHVNAPGNNAFREPANGVAAIDEQERTLDRAIAQFEVMLRALEGDLGNRPDPSVGAGLQGMLALATPPMESMVAESRVIFRKLREGQVSDAGVHMARMDEEYAHVVAQLGASSLIVAGIQKSNLQSQLRVVERLQAAELVFAAVILFTVGMVTVYGRKLARRMRDFQAELTQYRDHLEALVEERTNELEASLEKLRLRDRLASIGSLAAGLGHDMNNVLFPVRCWLDALAGAELDAESVSEVASIRQSVEYLQQLSDGLRLLALDPDEDVAAPGATDIQSWWDDVRPLFLTALPKEATLEGKIPIGLAPVGLARHQLTQAVFNLVVNAGAAIHDRGTVRVWARPGDDAGTVRIGVTDDGHGMTEEVRRQALDPFFTTRKRGLSTGLGLGLVQGVATAVDGRVDIDSAPGRGTTVTLTLPLVDEIAAAPDADGERWATVSLRDRRVATFAASLLRSAGFDVALAETDAAPGGSLWLTDASLSAESVVAFLDGGGSRRVIALGGPRTAGAGWNHPGVRVVDERAGLGAIREAIQDISQSLNERSE